MGTLIVIGFLGGLVTGISPCIIPVAPVIFAAGAVGGVDESELEEATGSPAPAESGEPQPLVAVGAVAGGGGAADPDPLRPPLTVPPAPGGPDAAPVRPPMTAAERAQRRRSARRRPYAVVVGLVVSFSFATLVGVSVLSYLGLPDDFLNYLGVVLLGLVGVGLVVPAFGDLLERPFARLVHGRQRNEGGGFVLGLSLGLLFIPCAGPVLAAITVAGSKHHIGFSALILTVAFAVGVAVPLLAFAIAGQRLGSRMKVVRRRASVIRRLIGVFLLLATLVLGLNVVFGLNVADSLQRDLPGYTDGLTNHLEEGATAKAALGGVNGNTGSGALAACTPASPVLARCGTAPALTGIQQWLNTPGDRPLTLAGLRGKVVLVDFWTYSCINCQRTLPHLEAWNQRYAGDGLQIIGVHTPEFAFEHVVSNVHTAAGQLGVRYPIAIDNNYDTWNAYQNDYWPAEYLIDATGVIRHVDFGEGQYGQTEGFIRQLLKAANPGVQLPPASDVPDRTPTEETTPEAYLGSMHPTSLDGQTISEGQAAAYTLPSSIPLNAYAYGGTWNIGSEASTAVTNAVLQLQFQAKDVYLVLGGTGTVGVSVDGKALPTVRVSGVPKLYQLVGGTASQTGLLSLTVSPGVAAYDFTFG